MFYCWSGTAGIDRWIFIEIFLKTGGEKMEKIVKIIGDALVEVIVEVVKMQKENGGN